MNRIDQLFQNKAKNVLTVYFTAGYPNLNDTKRTIIELDQSGVDCIEIGMPYSDPLADGETIQQSSAVALNNGLTLDILFEQLQGIRSETSVPLILMGYLNQLVQYGLDAFCKRAKEVGVDGLIIPDMPLHSFEKEYQKTIESYGLHAIFLITPRTPEDRIKKIDSLSKGFIYVVSDSSITGKQKGINDQQVDYFNRIKSYNLTNPLQVGFGISTHSDFARVCEHMQGAIIGSAFIRHVGAKKPVADFIHSILHAPVEN